MKLHVNRGHVSARQLEEALEDSGGGNSHLMNYVDEVSEHCEVCRPFDKARQVPIAGTSTVSIFNEKAQEDHLFLDEIIALRATDMYSKYSLILAVQPENPQEVWGVLCGG